MSAFPLSYRVQGEDDYMLEITIDDAGAFVINSGDHNSHEPRHGTLSRNQREQLLAALEGLGEPREHPAPEGAADFTAQLILGKGPQARRYRYWEGALEEDPALQAAVRELELI